MDYEKAYKNLVAKVKNAHLFAQTDSTKNVLEDILPELAEIEDERIRAEIIECIETLLKAPGASPRLCDWLAWLEKQKESLHISESCKENGESFTDGIIEVRSFQRGMEEGRRLEKQKEQKPNNIKREWWNKGYLEGRKNAHIPARELGLPSSWDFQKEQKPVEKPSKEDYVKKFRALCDAYEIKLPNREYDIYHLCKDLHKLFGDIQKPVEKSINWTELTWKDIVELEEIINSVHYEFCNGIRQESFGNEVLEKFREYKGDEYLDEMGQQPAEYIKRNSKEWNALLAEQYDKGYWKGKVEPKPAEWSEEDESMLNRIIETLSLPPIYDTKACAKMVSWLKSISLDIKKRNEDVAKLCSNEWNEEDEKMLQSIIDDFRKGHVSSIGQDQWLKSLRPQPKAELTLLDENIIEAAVAFVEQNDHFNVWRGIDKHTVLKALRSLKPHWKPSEEQMRALQVVVDEHWDVDGDALYSLYTDLKKLI